MASYQPLTFENHEEVEDTLHTPRDSLEDREDSQLIYSSKRDYAELEVDDSSAPEEALLRQDPVDDSPSILRLPTDGGSIFESFVNMANSIVGAGIIGLPFAFKEAGLWTGVILLIGLTIVVGKYCLNPLVYTPTVIANVFSIMVDWTVRLLIFNGKLTSQTTYIDLMDFAFGRPGRIAISIFSFIFAFGAMCAYCVIIGDTIPHVIRSLVPTIDKIPVLWIFSNRRLCITFFTVTVSWPLSMYRDISKLAKTSALALSAIFVIIITVLIEGPKMPAEIRGAPIDPLNFINNEVFQAIGVISFGNILNNFPQDNFLINIARLAFGLNMFTTVPLETFVCREVMEHFFWPNEHYNVKRHVILTTGLVLAALLISLTTCNLGFVLELTGGFSATALSYILPPACYLKLSGGNLWDRNKLRHWLCMVFGLVVMVLSTFHSIQKAFSGDDTQTQCDL
ncbi:hypothetical protein INT44_003907 [Umbelopsis vinacea]|uniref:Amino acid transporter transmembrane domain-containing protein n=1 Tax=Umbelopsis vinacea TaxID=44442 RepID=A0A8H7UQY1_9FUNG|nr:hypothetical protein INT44_003907 [Umbelopsis vinacea]